MTDTVEQALEYLSEASNVRVRWGTPMTSSTLLHALLLFLFLSAYESTQETPLPQVHVLEVNIMGDRDLALKGTGNDFGRGPLPDKTLLASPAKQGGRAVHGNTMKNSHSLVSRPGRPGLRTRSLEPLQAVGAIFGGGAREGGVEPGVGRDKIFAAPSAVKSNARASGPRGEGGGDGLVGVSGGPIDLKARRGSGEGGGGTGNFLMGGDGSTTGGNTLERRGEPIVQDYHSANDDLIGMKNEDTKIPALNDDAFFSIRGPLSHRKILKMKLPKYPRWAEESGVEGTVSVHMFVKPDGKVKPNAYIEQTSGYPQLDQLVLETVQSILFAPIADTEAFREEWGIASFNFRLKKNQRPGG